MNPKLIQILYNFSSALVALSIILTVLAGTGTMNFAEYDMMRFVYLSAVLWFIIWQLKRNKGF